MKKTHILTLFGVFILRCLPTVAQCAEVESVLKDIITQDLRPTVTKHDYDTYEKVSCYTLKEMSEDDFILLGRGLEYSNLTKNEPSSVEYNVLRMVDRQNGIACERIFIRKKNVSAANVQTYNQFERQRVANLLQAKKEQLNMLQKQQQYLSTDILNILGDVLVGQIDAPEPFADVVSEVAQKLKDLGINEVAKYYDLNYEPTENETANLVRKIIDPIDKTLGVFGIPTGKFLKYWEALKLTPDGGMAIGNVAAKVRIYFMEKELQDDIDHLKKRLEKIPNDIPSNAYVVPIKEGERFNSY